MEIVELEEFVEERDEREDDEDLLFNECLSKSLFRYFSKDFRFEFLEVECLEKGSLLVPNFSFG